MATEHAFTADRIRELLNELLERTSDAGIETRIHVFGVSLSR